MIERLLRTSVVGREPAELKHFNLPPLHIDFNEGFGEPNPLIREELNYDIARTEVDQNWDSFNNGQRVFADRLMREVDHPTDGQNLFFLSGPGGTGKTFVINTILSRLRSEGHVALAVAQSGIAATLLAGGTTAHSRFKIPLNADSSTKSNVAVQSHEAELLRRAKVIFWDEAVTQNRWDFTVLHKLLEDVCDSYPYNTWFAGKVVIFCGDFRQTLPIVVKGSPGQIIEKTICSAAFWDCVQFFTLDQNMRLLNPNLTDEGRREVEAFGEELQAVGDAEATYTDEILKHEVCKWPYGWLPSNERTELLDKIYNGVNDILRDSSYAQKCNYFAERAVLAITNYDVANINDEITDSVSAVAPTRTYRSLDVPKDERDKSRIGPEDLNKVEQPGLPPHRLRLHVGMPVMCLRNLDPPRICNGTRLIVTGITANVTKCMVTTGNAKGHEHLIPRIHLAPKDNDERIPCDFTRKQFPLRSCYAMTINKAQGQSLKYVGIDLRAQACFAHGQLYVALSRVTNKLYLYIIGHNHAHATENQLLHNVVYKQVLARRPNPQRARGPLAPRRQL